MTLFDYAVLAVIGISLVLSVMRGVVKEVLALAGWLAAFWLASHYAVQISAWLPESVPGQTVRVLAAFVIIFLGALLLMSLLTITLSELIRSVGLGMTDRVLGALFGCARGILIVAILVLLAGLTTLPRQGFWRNAMFSAPLEAMVLSAKPWLPEGLSGRISYE